MSEWRTFITNAGHVFEHKDHGEIEGEYVSEVRFKGATSIVHVPRNVSLEERINADYMILRVLGVIDPETCALCE